MKLCLNKPKMALSHDAFTRDQKETRERERERERKDKRETREILKSD